MDSRHLTSQVLVKRNVETPIIRPSGQASRKGSCWMSGRGCWKKRMPACNALDTRLVLGPKGSPRPTGVSSQESLKNRLDEGKTIDGCFGSRRALDEACIRSPVTRQVLHKRVGDSRCVLRRRSKSEYCHPAAGSEDRPQKCLSRMLGNSHVRFLEELGVGNGPRVTRHATSHRYRSLTQ